LKIQPEAKQFFHHRFRIPGIDFWLFLGGLLSSVEKQYCAANSPLHPVYLSCHAEQQMIVDFSKQIGSATTQAKLESYFQRTFGGPDSQKEG
jgi:hypothetical protein